MTTVVDITERLRAGLEGQAGLDRTIKIDLKGDGFIFVDGAHVSNDDAPADCTLVVSAADLVAIARGQLDPAMALMRGKLKVRGDMTVAMKLPSLLSRARG